jgi:hypothetical protein
MNFRQRARRFAGGLVVATALLIAVPGQALAASTPPAPAPPPMATPAPVPFTAAPVPAPHTSPPTPERAPAPPTARGQISQIPSGAPDTGGGSTAGDTEMVLVALGMLGLAGAAGLGGALARRRPRDTAQD